MSLKIEFVARVQQGEPIAPLCREYGISRTTGHKWWRRYQAQGYGGLDELSRRPKTAPLATAEELVVAVIEARDAHPSWGPQKLAPVLRRRFGDQTPSPRTIARILKQAKRVRGRRKRAPVHVIDRAPRVDASEPNAVWTVDFKGWWRAVNGQRCEPLTIRDAFSRFVLECRLCRSSADEVRKVLEVCFRRYGLPQAIHCDNGVPFVCVRAAGGLSVLSAWWVSLGIRIVRSRPACPQDNGAHERMHRDLRAEVQSEPAEDRAAQQRALDRWRQEFNHVRPHQALGQRTPAEAYRPSSVRMPKTIEYRYPRHMEVRRVQRNGCIRRRDEYYFVSKSLRGHAVGLEPLEGLRSRVWFFNLELCTLEIAPDVGPEVFDLVNPERTMTETG